MNSTESSAYNWDRWAQIWIEAILMPIVSFLGLIGRKNKHKSNTKTDSIPGNSICILVLTKKKEDLGMKPSFIDLLILLVKHCQFLLSIFISKSN